MRTESLSEQVIRTNIEFLKMLKQDAFNGDHPGIDKIVKEMKQNLKRKNKK